MKPRVTEAEFTRMVLQLARLHGWRTFHSRPARTNKGWRTPVQGDGIGFVDLVMVRAGVILFVELKVPPNRVTAGQGAWLFALEETGLYVRVWTPDDWPEIEQTLRRGA